MKKSWITLLALVLTCVMLFAACGNKAEEKDDDEKEEDATSEVVTTEANGEDAPTGENTELPLPSVSTPAVTEPSVPAEKTDADKVAEFVASNKAELISSFEEGFSSTGMTCSTTIEAVGTGIVLEICLGGVDNLTADQKAVMQDSFDQMASLLSTELTMMQMEIPELTYLTFRFCEADGDLIASVDVTE